MLHLATGMLTVCCFHVIDLLNLYFLNDNGLNFPQCSSSVTLFLFPFSIFGGVKCIAGCSDGSTNQISSGMVKGLFYA